ncbi:PBAN-type neuropeptides [Fopius arisanus]|uniref:PBAN protein n=1 Tax=Fopius arisanus TaxID=64838 RepID=A0A0C9Q7J7_9HYME|nr:PREDICTED: PBAN-type neuropeptides-like [Fopius arisanus]
MVATSCTSACVLVACLLAAIDLVICDYDGDQPTSLDFNGLCNGGRCSETGDGIAGAMWFGPRLGRKRRSDEKMETIDEDVEAMADVINGGPWTYVQYPGAGDKRHTTQFTPRLGRELTDDILQKYLNYDLERNRLSRYIDREFEDMTINHHQPPTPPPQFAPRLGRHLPFNPSPRLGRHLRFMRRA